MSNGFIRKAISNELDKKVIEVQDFMKNVMNFEISYIEATKILARKIGLYKIPLNPKELKELEKMLGKNLKE